MNASREPDAPAALEHATLGAGCFWCVEAVFLELKGVASVTSGYAGGETANPSYEEVCGGRTGHAEVVRIAYDPREITFADLLEVFWRTHDPTTPNRQGNDVGPQYRSVIFYHDDEQRRVAEEMRTALDEAALYADKIVTEIVPLTSYYAAEDYHQDYFAQNPAHPYCLALIPPKLEKLRHAFAERMK